MSKPAPVGLGGRSGRVPFATPLVGTDEAMAVEQILHHRILTNGGQTRAFEAAFSETIGGGACAAVSSCTSGLYLALAALGIKPGDEVIVPAQTFVACSHVVEALGARPVFVDVWPDSGVMDPALMEQAITPRTKAVMPVHYAGRPCYMGTIMDVARRHNLKVVEDCATALGAWHSHKSVGLIGDVGVFSFHPVKHITTCEGGMVVTRNMALYRTICAMREFGKVTEEGAALPGIYDVPGFGLNFRMSEVHAAIGLVQLASLPDRLEKRRANYLKMSNALQGFDVLNLDGHGQGAAYCLVVRLETDQAEARKELARRSIESSIYYPGPLPLMSYYAQKYGYTEGMFPVAEGISRRAIALPVGPHITDVHIASMVSALKDIARRAA